MSQNSHAQCFTSTHAFSLSVARAIKRTPSHAALQESFGEDTRRWRGHPTVWIKRRVKGIKPKSYHAAASV